MHMSQNGKCALQCRQAQIIVTHTNKCRQLIFVPVGYTHKSTMHACKVYVMLTMGFIVKPTKWCPLTSVHKVYWHLEITGYSCFFFFPLLSKFLHILKLTKLLILSQYDGVENTISILDKFLKSAWSFSLKKSKGPKDMSKILWQ